MLRHMEDNADLNMLVDKGGNLICVCSKCKRMWTGHLTPSGTSSQTAKMKKDSRTIKSFYGINPSLFRSLRLDAGTLKRLKITE